MYYDTCQHNGVLTIIDSTQDFLARLDETFDDPNRVENVKPIVLCDRVAKIRGALGQWDRGWAKPGAEAKPDR